MTLDALIIGGGLAGLTSAISLSQKGFEVVVIEKNTYPKHKVCGEYISNEVLSFLNSLGFDPFSFEAKKIDTFLVSSERGRTVTAPLPLGGFSLSRFTLDAALSRLAQETGVKFIQDTVVSASFNENEFEVHTKTGATFTSKIVIGAFGKRSNLDKNFDRKFMKEHSPYLAVKAHYKIDFPKTLIQKYQFCKKGELD